MLYIWHEDNNTNSITKQFLEFLKYYNVNSALNDSIIRGFGGYTELFNGVQDLIYSKSVNDVDNYIILMDCVPDNDKVYKLYKLLKTMVQPYSNISLSNILCIEYLLLDFKYFRSWTRPKVSCEYYDKLYNYRCLFLQYVKTGDWSKSKNLRQYVCDRFKQKNGIINEEYIIRHTTLEKLAYYLLVDLTSFGIFKTNKTKFSPCWYCDCCANTYIGKIKCSLYYKNKNGYNKALMLYKYTKVNTLFEFGHK